MIFSVYLFKLYLNGNAKLQLQN